MKYRGYTIYNGEKSESEFDVKKYTEDSLYGEGTDSGGNFSIEGKLQKSGRIDLEKYYMGEDKIFLFGRGIVNDGKIERMYGCWEIKNVCSGDFEYKLFK